MLTCVLSVGYKAMRFEDKLGKTKVKHKTNPNKTKQKTVQNRALMDV